METSVITYPRIMKDDKLEQELTEKGYLVLKNFFDKDAVKELQDYHRNNQPEFYHNDAIINSVWHTDDVKYKRKTIEKIISVYTRFCDQYFVDYKIFGGSFVIKPPHGKGASHPHIDFGIVDEETYRSFNLWAPLVKLTKENGALQVLEGSHRIKHVFRGPNIPDQTIAYREWFWEKQKKFYLEPGDALLYDHKAIHGSKDNFSSQPRIAVSCAMTNLDAEMMMYFQNEEQKKVRAYKVDTEYLLNTKHNNIPTNFPVYKEWDYHHWQLSPEDFGSLPEVQKKSLIERVKELFVN